MSISLCPILKIIFNSFFFFINHRWVNDSKNLFNLCVIHPISMTLKYLQWFLFGLSKLNACFIVCKILYDYKYARILSTLCTFGEWINLTNFLKAKEFEYRDLISFRLIFQNITWYSNHMHNLDSAIFRNYNFWFKRNL